MAPNKCTICLIGPVGSGKTSLLQTFVDCTEQSTHGYELGRRIQVQDIDPKVFETGVAAAPKLLASQNGDYQQLKRQFFRQTTATEKTLDYYFRLDMSAPRAHGESVTLIRIVDSAGEFAIPESDDRVEGREEQIQKLRDALEQADAVVFAVPLTKLDGVGWQGGLRRVIYELSHADLKNPSRVVIAFTHYERMFVNLGQSAFEFACSPRVARDVMSRALDQSNWADSLNKLHQRGVDIYFTVTSAYGFVKGYGNPNIDPHQVTDEMPFGRNGTAASMARFWRPFLTAEPFICAALNEPSQFAIPFEDIYRLPPPPDAPKEHGRFDELSQRVGRIVNWFNRTQ